VPTQERTSHVDETSPALYTSAGVLCRLAAQHMVQAGLMVGPLLVEAGIHSNIMEDEDVRIGVKSQVAFVNLVADSLQDGLLGFHIARDFDLRKLGAFYYLMASSEAVSPAIDMVTRYDFFMNEGIRVRQKRTSLFSVDYDYVGLERRLDRHQIEFWVTCMLRLCRHLTRLDLIPTSVQFAHPHEGDISEMESYFGIHISFEAQKDSLSFDARVADLPLVTADPYLNRILRSYYQESLDQQRRAYESLRVRVENAIVPRLPHGTAAIGNIASDLGMSTRTLSRRLADDGLTFTGILDDLRSDLARRYLPNRTLSISQIAWLLGYKELSSFVHAFQRWTGRTPTEVRRHLRSAEAPESHTNTEGSNEFLQPEK